MLEAEKFITEIAASTGGKAGVLDSEGFIRIDAHHS